MPSEPVLLAFDTSAAHCAAALLCGDRLLAQRHEEMARGQAERLMPLIADLLRAAGIGVRDLSAVGVGVGPGNFTGIRIAVAAARGLALACDIQAIGVTAFEALREGNAGPALTSVDARRGRIHLCGADGGLLQAISPDELPQRFRDIGLPVIGHEADALAALTGGDAVAPAFPVAEAVARAAARRLGTPLPRPAPLYLRPADAAPPADPPPVILP